MFDIYKVAKNLNLKVSEGNDNKSYFITVPYFYAGYDESIAIKVTWDELYRPTLSDCRTTLDYLEYRNVCLTDYNDKLSKIMQRFSLTLDADVFRMAVPSDDGAYIELYIGYFIQALALIAYINL